MKRKTRIRLGFVLSPVAFVLVTVYAPLMSIRSLKSKETEDDAQWLSFWVIWSLITAIDSVTWGLLWLIPFFAEIRFGALIYLQFYGGGKVMFDAIIDPMYTKVCDAIPKDQMDLLANDPKTFILNTFNKGKDMLQAKMNK